MTQFTTRAYNSIEFHPNRGTIVKSSNNQRFADEIRYYHHVPQLLRAFFPSVIDNGPGWAEIEYVNYLDLGKRVLTTTEERFWSATFKSIHNILSLFSTKRLGVVSEQHLCEMYIEKTFNEYHKIGEKPEMKELLGYDHLIINSVKNQNFKAISGDVLKLIDKLLFNQPARTMIHGDFCLANILASYNSDLNYTCIKLIDPRGSWGEQGIYGDPRYDIAKLYHSLDGGYEYVVSNNFDITLDGNRIDYRFSNTNKNKIFEIMKNELKITSDEDKMYRLIEGLIYIGMVARHYENLSHQQIFYVRGIEMLNQLLQETA